MHNPSKQKTPMPVQEPEVRSRNFDEVALGYNEEQAVSEAQRCLNCRNKPCVGGCPVSINIPAFIHEVAERNFEGAYEILSRSTALPAVCGRVCPQESQCESRCVCGIKGEPVGIGRLERFVADWHSANATEKPVRPAPNGHKVAVIGSGPSGLSCAGELARKGYAVTVFEALHLSGGVLVYGIPEFRLPKFMGIPGESWKGVYSANEFLTRINLMKAYRPDSATPVQHGKKVAVVGGGNVAMDAARCARRLGAEVTIVYRRTEAELPARKEEVEHAKEEGIAFRFLTNPLEILADDQGWVRSIRCQEMALGEPDASGRRRPVPVEGSEMELPMDCVIMALGTSPNPLIKSTTEGLETQKWGGIVADADTGLTSRPGVYAGGDAGSGAATVILAMGAGKTAASAIDRQLMG